MTFVVVFWLKLSLHWKSDLQLLPCNGMYTYSNLWKSSCWNWKVRFWFVFGIINWLNLSQPKNLCNWPVHAILGTDLNRIEKLITNVQLCHFAPCQCLDGSMERRWVCRCECHCPDGSVDRGTQRHEYRCQCPAGSMGRGRWVCVCAAVISGENVFD